MTSGKPLPGPGVYSELLHRGWDQMLPGVFSYSKKNAIINYIWALGQHFHILSVTHSVSVRGRQRHFGFTQKHWESWDDGPPGSLWIWVSSQRELGIWGDGLGAAESHRQPWTRASQTLLRCRCPGAAVASLSLCKDADPHSISPPSSSESDHYCDYEPLT